MVGLLSWCGGFLLARRCEFMSGAIVRKFFVLFLFILTVIVPGVLRSKSYYVAPGGDNGNPGTIEAPFASLKKAHDNGNLQPGDVIYLRGGTYYPTQQTVFTKAGSADKYFILRSYPGEVPIINGRDISEGNINSVSTPTWAFINAEYWKIFGSILLTNGREPECILRAAGFLNLIRLKAVITVNAQQGPVTASLFIRVLQAIFCSRTATPTTTPIISGKQTKTG